jgi:asparagine synthase (glutamine-hydrolysing)
VCGIAGILNFDGSPVLREEIGAMVAAEAHRGPDAEGIRTDGPVGIGHRRLSIIDLEHGGQPMASEDGGLRITFNGEIYNFRELRADLESRGHRFRTRSDTEVVLHAYAEYGDDCVLRLRGMFAFGIVDERARRIFLARDHFGIKPLVYSVGPRRFAFASEIRALKPAAGSGLELDLAAVDSYLKLQYIPAPASVYRQIRKLSPAHRMSVAFDGGISGPEPYWRPGFRSAQAGSEAERVEALVEALSESVRAHLVADVPVGAFLSGGVDSSAVVAFMAQHAEGRIRTFSIGFDESAYDELPYAAEVARRWGTDHHVEVVRGDAMGLLPELARAYGEPFGDSSAIPTYHVSRLARRHVPVVLSGDGGDELFAGYPNYARWLEYLEGPGLPPRPAWKRLLRPAASRLLPGRFPPSRERGSDPSEWLDSVSLIPDAARRALWRPEFRHLVGPPDAGLSRDYEEAWRYRGARAAQAMDLASYLPGCILTKVDIASMMSSLEVRTPLLDVRLAEMVSGIPESMNIGRNADGEWEGKRLLKKALSRYYPAWFLARRKRGFSIPLREWLLGEGSGHREAVRERLTGSDSRLSGFLEPEAVRRQVDAGDAPAVWLLLFLEEWLRGNGVSA